MGEGLASVQIVVFTRSHIISGEISLHDQRLSDYLNDRLTTLLQFKYASIERLNDPGRVIATFYSSILPKKSIVLAFNPPQKETPLVRRFIGVVKEKHEVLVALEGTEVRGTVHTTGPLDPQQILTSLSESFLPVTQATVSFTINSKLQFKQDTILVNVPEIRFMGELLSSSPTQPRKYEPPPSQ
jgi:hypothetical protein